MMYRMALPLVALMVAGGCGSDVSGPMSQATMPGTSVAASHSAGSSPRSGALNVTKDCSTYFGRAGDYCTITSSNLKAIEVGSRITYASAAVWPNLDTDIVLDPPGPGNNRAFGHCTLNLVTGIGVCTLSGGTGKFTWLQASVAVSYVGGPTFAWDGTYSYDH